MAVEGGGWRVEGSLHSPLPTLHCRSRPEHHDRHDIAVHEADHAIFANRRVLESDDPHGAGAEKGWTAALTGVLEEPGGAVGKGPGIEGQRVPTPIAGDETNRIAGPGAESIGTELGLTFARAYLHFVHLRAGRETNGVTSNNECHRRRWSHGIARYAADQQSQKCCAGVPPSGARRRAFRTSRQIQPPRDRE